MPNINSRDGPYLLRNVRQWWCLRDADNKQKVYDSGGGALVDKYNVGDYRQMNIERIGRVHAIGYGLEELGFEASRDFKVNIAGVDVSVRRGETSKMPYWMGLTLEENGLGIVKLPDMVTALKQALSKERISGNRAFQTLEPLFYVKLKETMKRLEGRDYDKVYDMLLELFRMRNAKIVTKASSMKLNAEMNSKLTVEERAFYNAVHLTCSEFETQITTIAASSGMVQNAGDDFGSAA